MGTDDTDQYLIVAEVASSGTPTVGSVPRPPRVVTVGRRRSDRIVAYSLTFAFALSSLFVVYQAFRTQQLVDLVHDRTTLTCPR